MKQKIEIVERPAVEMRADHSGFEMTAAIGFNLADRRAALSEAFGVVIGFEIADEGGDAMAAMTQLGQRLFQQHGFASAGAGNEIEDENASGFEGLAHFAGEFVVLVENVLADFENARSH